MFSFTIHFIISCLLLFVLIGALLLLKFILKKHISNRLQYQLWFFMLLFLIIPFFPAGILNNTLPLSQFVHSENLAEQSLENDHTVPYDSTENLPRQVKDFALSVNYTTSKIIQTLFLSIWLTGAGVMLLYKILCYIHLSRLTKAACSIKNPEIHNILDLCRQELGIEKEIPLYSISYFSTPITTGLFKPVIYLPKNFISETKKEDMRYIFLHELQHYKHKDAFINTLMNLASIVYWFHPLVRFSLKRMRNDREIACDTSVLQMLHESEYISYGHTLINFAQKASRLPMSSVNTMGGTFKQIQKRIINIAGYEKETLRIKLKSICILILVGSLFLGSAPLLAFTSVETEEYFTEETISERTLYEELETYFDHFEGAFVLYDLKEDLWSIYNEKASKTRVSPDSTYKIYSALFALEANVISPESTALSWDKQEYPFESWNQNQDLQSAMENSVNWYFESLDQDVGLKNLKTYYEKVQYGNKDLSDGYSFWMESSLKISPIEQVELLKNVYLNKYEFHQENIDLVKESMLIYKDSSVHIYGKSGTGRLNGKDINGWFIGFIEKGDQIYFFATNIRGDEDATGAKASEITMSIWKDYQIVGIGGIN